MDLNIYLLLVHLGCFYFIILCNLAMNDSIAIFFLLKNLLFINSQRRFIWITGHVTVELSPLKGLWGLLRRGNKEASHLYRGPKAWGVKTGGLWVLWRSVL